MRKYFPKFKSANSRLVSGFTLIEILITASLVVYTSITVIRNFVTTRINYERVASVMASDIRFAQQLALSARQYQGSNDPAPRNRCGYGITTTPRDNSDPANDQRRYSVYAGPPTVNSSGGANNCGNPKYTPGNNDQPFYRSVTLDSRLNFYDSGIGQAPPDIFFKPPNPLVYFDNSLGNIDQWQQIVIKDVNVKVKTGPGLRCDNGSPKCIYICVYGSGRVEVSKVYNSCP